MAPRDPSSFLIIGAGAAGLIAARELSRAGRRVTILEARDRCGGRIYSLPVQEFGYPGEGGAEFVHGAAPVTRGLMREAGLSLLPRAGRRWSSRTGALSPDDWSLPHAARFYQALSQVKADLPIAEFLQAHFAEPKYDQLRRSVTRTVEGYDAADPRRASTLALRDEWMARDDGEHGRINGGYGALIDYLVAESRRYGAALHLGVPVVAIDERRGGVAASCRGGARFEADAAILSVPLPLLSEIKLPAPEPGRISAAAADIGFGNVVKFLLRFSKKWWAEYRGRDLSDLSFLLSDAPVPTWWTQYPADYPVLTGWLAGPKADRVSSLAETQLVDLALASLAEILDLSPDCLRNSLVAARAIDWGKDPFARGAYSYATPKTRAAQSALRAPHGPSLFVAGEAIYAGSDMGTVEAALASGLETARTILAGAGAGA